MYKRQATAATATGAAVAATIAVIRVVRHSAADLHARTVPTTAQSPRGGHVLRSATPAIDAGQVQLFIRDAVVWDASTDPVWRFLRSSSWDAVGRRTTSPQLATYAAPSAPYAAQLHPSVMPPNAAEHRRYRSHPSSCSVPQVHLQHMTRAPEQSPWTAVPTTAAYD